MARCDQIRLQMTMISSILILILHVHVYHINSVFINYTERCPGDNLERILRATALCSTIEEYHCLYDEDFHLAEICQNYKQIPKGRFPRYSSIGDAIYYDPCPETRYQHGPAKSFQITDCLFEKSKCVSEGQKLCTTGTASTDSTCECDYKNGYAMIGGKCCSPTSYEDCTCFRKDCPDENQELDPDYNCVNKCASGFDRKEGDFYCTVKLHTSIDIETTSPTTPAFEDGDEDEKPHDDTAKSILFLAFGVYFLHILFLLNVYLYGCVKSIWRPVRYKLTLYSVWCGVTFACLILGWHFISERKTVAIILSALLVVLICFYCLLIFVLWTHQIQKERKVYNEEYDVRIFGLLMAASKGDMNKLKQLKDEKYIDMEDTDYDKRSALHLAAVTGNVEAVDFLLKYHFCFPGAHDRWGRSVSDDIKWHLNNRDNEDRKEKYETIKKKISTYQESSVQGKKKKREHFLEIKAIELIKAAEKGDLDTVKRLKNLGTDMSLSNSRGQTALHAAAENSMVNIVGYLLNKCEVSSFVRMRGQRPIDVVPSDGEKVNNTIKEMLQTDMNESLTKEVKKMEPLDYDLKIVRLLNAASRGDIKQMRSYYEAGYDMKAADYDNRTALHIAVSDNQDHIIRFLLEVCELHEIAKYGKDRWDTTPLSASRERGKESVYYVLLELCPELVDTENDQYRTYLLLNAGADNDVQTLRRLCEKNVDMDLRDYDGRTALHLAAAENNLEAVKYLVETAEVKRSIPDRENRKPVDEAVTYREKKKDLTDNEEQDNKEIIDILKKAKDKEQPQETQSTLCEAEQIKVMVMQAAAEGDLQTLEQKQFTNVSMDSCDYFKDTPLHVCVAKAKISVVQYLIEKRKVSPFVRNSFWKTPLHLVQDKIDYWKKRENTTRQEDFDKIKEILENAMKSSSSIDVKVDDNFEKHKKDEKAKIFLFLNKAYKGDIKAVGRYLKTDPELLRKHNYDKRTALHLAAAEGHIELVKFIVKQEDVDKGKEDRWGTTPLDEAKKKGDQEIIDILQS